MHFASGPSIRSDVKRSTLAERRPNPLKAGHFVSGVEDGRRQTRVGALVYGAVRVDVVPVGVSYLGAVDPFPLAGRDVFLTLRWPGTPIVC